ncbi:hypothetical protein QNH39_18585 [Neobacillus novalis]|uniref:Uncharacterized protein n=1 Tax=Neobacillus novalis TaxID=220687 RepID=A0AA95MJ62_9BACI|nr:hypothetical protein [Neobacillus novalis]WHY84646.1 hypothetical protein QNH39_18585 [Neobacillus novalis]
MNKEIEEIIVKSFFNKRIQQRVLFELSSSKKRQDAIERLNHNYLDTLRNEFMIEIPKPNSDPEEIVNLLKVHGASKNCYVISWHSLDGKEFPLTTAIEELIWYGMPSFISCTHGKLAYFQAEQVYGAPPRFILKRTL